MIDQSISCSLLGFEFSGKTHARTLPSIMNRRRLAAADAVAASSSSNKKLRRSSSCSSDEEDDDEDRISDLSDNVLHHILSFLNMEQAIQTSVLSRRWRFLWSSLPFLKFDSNLYFSRSKKSPDSFKAFVDKVLLQRDNSNIQCLNLMCHGLEHSLTSWILYALRFNLQELRLLVVVDGGGLFRLPHRLFTCTSLTSLLLNPINNYSRIRQCVKLTIPESISFPVLTNLHIQRISFQGDGDDDDDSINRLISSCPRLEKLYIINCEFRCNYLRISSFKLKHLRIERHNFKRQEADDGSVIISTPNLISFHCKDFLLKNDSVDEFPALNKASIDMARDEKEYQELLAQWKEMYVLRMTTFMRTVQNVKTLTLSGSVLQILSKADVSQESTPVQFRNLRCLKLVTPIFVDCIPGITYVLKMCPNIETFSLMTQWKLKPPFGDEINFDSANIGDDSEAGLSSEWPLHHLKHAEFQYVVGCVGELKFLQVVLKHSLVLEKLSITTSALVPCRQKLLWKFREKLLKFPISSPRLAIVLV